MKLLLTADIHGSELAVKRLRAIGKCFDMVIVCGDITPKYRWEGESLVEVQKKWFYGTFLPLMDEINGYFILGNDDFVEYDGERVIKNGMELENGLHIYAYEYVPPTPFHTNREKSDEDIWEDLKNITPEKPFIFITHAPPYQILDKIHNRSKPLGSMAVRGFVFEHKPLLHAFGHIHESFGDIEFKGIKFINASFGEEARFYVAEFTKNGEKDYEIDIYSL